MSVRAIALIAAALVAVLMLWLPIWYLCQRHRMPAHVQVLHGTVSSASIRTRPGGPDSVIFQLAGSPVQFRYFGRDPKRCQTVCEAIRGQDVSVWYQMDGGSAGLLGTALRIERNGTPILSAAEGLRAFQHEQFTMLMLLIEPALLLLLVVLVFAVGR